MVVETVPSWDGVPLFPSPAGGVLSRVATVSDMHVGEPGFGMRHRIAEPRGTSPSYTVRALRAALAEAVAWGAELIVVKGDMTWSARAWQWEAVADALGACRVPVVAALGNHDVSRRGVNGRVILERAGVQVVDGALAIDVRGARVVVANTAVRGLSEGSVDASLRARIVALASAAPTARSGVSGVIVMLHHYVDRFSRPTRYPKGVPAGEGRALLRELAAVGNVLVTCGHSHRHRRYEREGVAVSEVGSTKDYPGVWAGYAVDAGGVRQVVKRIEEPSVVAWTERTAGWMGGAWGAWTPGLRSWRCFRVDWR